ncbi:uncharacterized protein B0T15DRAFT_54137 [Chaetomium strumarium]|uniref:Uncharacterized protein n=1 Tax=Chaetomium strumarium TaxID=1170767 RepID=A0AAJ0H3K4_9PEZI|nr:hypothetical protein B0T15DRAFT_54137 [Chaetomium strumarium]
MATETQCESDGAGSLQKPEWLRYLEDYLGIDPGSVPDLEPEVEDAEPEDIASVLASKIREYLLCRDDDAAARFARQLDDLYASVYEPKFGEFRGRQGWTGYLNAFYEVLFGAAVEMPYHDPLQDKVIHLLLELRKLPPHSVKVFVQPEFGWVDSEIWTRDPLLPWELVRHEPQGYLSLDMYSKWDDQEDAAKQFHETAAYHVNFSAFRARCTGAGLDEGFTFRFTTAGATIERGLQSVADHPSKLNPNVDYHIIAAAQYILLAGDVIDAECVKKQLPPHRHHDWKGWANGNGPVLWRQWGDRLKQIADALESGGELDFKLSEKNGAALKDIVTKARDKMVALEPELFAQEN